ncbi:MAG: beta-ketoacyl-[acyl-carrier-protein] synthase family protein [Bacteroidetes bacterium]|nr:beta-ketoacyl-[acyl-carrier-protein] synthase family protein [Bacteroidota bacterium]
MSASVLVAGVGVMSSIGNNVAESLDALESGKAGMGDMHYLDSLLNGKLPVAEVKFSNQQLATISGLSSSVSRTAQLSMIAAREALNDASIKNFDQLRTGFISANTVAGMDKTENFFSEFLSDPSKGKLRDVVHHECGSASELVADELAIRNYVTTISTACSSSANSIFFGARLIKHNMLDVVIAGGTDALTKFTLNGFNTLMILDQNFCKPFDEHRQGLNLGEGAGYVVLVSERVAASLEKNPYCRLSGYCNANDAYHQTASSPNGTGSFMAMKGALDKSELSVNDISYINLHGTGTQNNDISEGTAIKDLFGPSYPKMSSTKSFTGHTLGASGGIEAVFSVLAIKHGIIYPNLRLTDPMKELPFVPETKFLKNQNIEHVLSNSFGFGGNCSSLIFSKI